MNNFRFKNGGKRKFVLKFPITDKSNSITTFSVVDKLIPKFLNSAAVPNTRAPRLIRIESIMLEAEPTASGSVISDPISVNVLGRQSEVVASNNAGPDGIYKIPEDCILRKWHLISYSQPESSDPSIAMPYSLMRNVEGLTQPLELVSNMEDTGKLYVYVTGSYVE